MIAVTTEFKIKVIEALATDRELYGGSTAEFTNRWKINPAIYSRIKGGETENVLADAKWLEIGRKLDVSLKADKWVFVKTDVFNTIEQDVDHCQTHSRAMIYVDDCGTGKTVATTHLARTRRNCFRVDASQAKDTLGFIKELAKVIGVNIKSKIRSEIKAEISYYLRNLETPIVIIDEAGDITPAVVMEIKELWNATEGCCGWYLIGAEAFRVFIDRGIRNNKPGFRELFSRFGEVFSKTVPNGTEDKKGFYRKLIGDVLAANMADTKNINGIINKCITEGVDGKISGLRRAQSLLILNNQAKG